MIVAVQADQERVHVNCQRQPVDIVEARVRAQLRSRPSECLGRRAERYVLQQPG